MKSPHEAGAIRGVSGDSVKSRQHTEPGSQPQALRRGRTAALLTLLRNEYPALAEFRPLAIGIHVALRRVDVSNKLLRRALARHCRQRRYFQALAAGGARFALDGTACGEVTESQRETAKAKLEQAATVPAPPPGLPVLSLPKRRRRP